MLYAWRFFSSLFVYILLYGFLFGYIYLESLRYNDGFYIVDCVEVGIPIWSKYRVFVDDNDDQPQFKCYEFMRIGWKLFALFFLFSIFYYYSLFPIEFETER